MKRFLNLDSIFYEDTLKIKGRNNCMITIWQVYVKGLRIKNNNNNIYKRYAKEIKQTSSTTIDQMGD